jgi:hypothetical protein
MVAAITQDRLETLQAGFEDSIINIGMAGTPAFNAFKKMQKKMPTKVVWARKILSRMRDRVNMSGNISSTATAWTVDGSTATNPVKVWPGYMAALIGTEWVTIDAQPTSTTWTVTRAAFGSTAATHTDNDYIYLVPINAIGSAKLGKDDSQFAGREHNLVQNYHDEIPVANLLDEGRMPSWVDVNEASPEEQRKNLDYRARKAIELCFWYSRRNNLGGAAATTSNLTLTADGGKNTTGGVHYFNAQHSGLTPSSSSAPPTIVDIQTDLRDLRDRGAFEGFQTTEYGDASALLVCDLVSFSKINQLPWPQIQITNPGGKEMTYGTYTRRLMIDGILVDIEASSEVQAGHYFLLPKKKDRFQIRIQRFCEKQPVNPDGDQRVCIYATTWLNVVGDGYTTVFRSSLATS